MPTYKYECQSCGYIFEKFQTMTDAAVKICPQCGEEVQRIISSGAGLIFKGSGFYQTDYKTCPASTGASSGDKNTDSGCCGCSCSR
jgi:putative FmdB family regulatory protein